MHCASYFPGYYNAIDLIPGSTGVPWSPGSSDITARSGATGVSWSPGNSDITGRSGMSYNISLQQSSPDHYMAYVKDLMRQTMLKHEAMFRYQVLELHRLYRRQKELMNEHQRRYIQLQMSQLDPNMYPIQPNISRNVLHDPHWPSAEKFRGPVDAVQIEKADTNPSLKIGNGQELNFFSKISNKLGKRMLDLELPADQNIESEEEENIVEKDIEVPRIQCYPSKESSELVYGSGLDLNSIRSTSSISLDSTCGRRTCLIDLNEPVQLDDLDIPNFVGHVESSISRMESINLDQDLSQKSNKESEVSNAGNACTIQEGEDIDARSEICNLEERRVELLPHGSKSVEPKILGSCVSSSHQSVPLSGEPTTNFLCSTSSRRKSKQEWRKIPETIQALPCFITPKLLDNSCKSAIESSKNNNNVLHSKENSATNPSFGNGSSYPTLEECSPFKRFKNSDYKKSDMDSNCMPPKCSSEAVAPRENDKNVDGESAIESSVNMLSWQRMPSFDDNNLDSTSPFEVNDRASIEKEGNFEITMTRDRKSKERDFEAPVSPENKECSPPRGESENLQLEKEDRHFVEELGKMAAETIILMSSSLTPNCLEWFAGVVSSVAGNLENDVENLLDGPADSNQKVLRSQNDEKTADDSLRICQGRRRRQQRVLKKKALNNLGELKGATEVALGKVTKRKRNSGENKQRLFINKAHDIDLGKCLRGWGLTKGQRKARSVRRCFHDFPPLADFNR